MQSFVRTNNTKIPVHVCIQKKNNPQWQQYTWVKKQHKIHWMKLAFMQHALHWNHFAVFHANIYIEKPLWFNTPFLTRNYCQLSFFLKIHYFGKILSYQKVILILVSIIKILGFFLTKKIIFFYYESLYFFFYSTCIHNSQTSCLLYVIFFVYYKNV